MRILFVTPDIRWPLSHGAAIRRWNILQGLKRVGEVDAAFLRKDDSADYGAFLGCHDVVKLGGGVASETHKRLYESTIGRGLLTVSTLYPFDYQIPDRDSLRARLRVQLSAVKYDLVWLETIFVALILGRTHKVPAILDGDDFGYVRNLTLLRSTPHYGAKVWNYLDVVKLWLLERSLAKKFTYVVRCSEEDRVLHQAKNVVVIPNGTSIPEQVVRRPECRALFVGLLGYAPNALGLRWFLSEVWPRVRSVVHEAALDIVGKDPPENIRDANGRDGVVVHGFVSDLTPFYERAAVSVVPLWAGGGTRLKILEALARAVPVVSTSIGAYGIPAGEAEYLERADCAEAFAKRCIAALLDKRSALSGRDLVMRQFDWINIQEDVARLATRAVRVANDLPGILRTS